MTSHSHALLVTVWQQGANRAKRCNCLAQGLQAIFSMFTPAVLNGWAMHTYQSVGGELGGNPSPHTSLHKIMGPRERGVWPQHTRSYAKIEKEPQLAATGLLQAQTLVRDPIGVKFTSGLRCDWKVSQICESLIGFRWAVLKSNLFAVLEFRVHFQSCIYYKDKQTKPIFQKSPFPKLGTV